LNRCAAEQIYAHQTLSVLEGMCMGVNQSRKYGEIPIESLDRQLTNIGAGCGEFEPGMETSEPWVGRQSLSAQAFEVEPVAYEADLRVLESETLDERVVRFGGVDCAASGDTDGMRVREDWLEPISEIGHSEGDAHPCRILPTRDTGPLRLACPARPRSRLALLVVKLL